MDAQEQQHALKGRQKVRNFVFFFSLLFFPYRFADVRLEGAVCKWNQAFAQKLWSWRSGQEYFKYRSPNFLGVRDVHANWA